MRTLEYNVDAIYLDSAHEYGETFLELMMYWEVLKPGGVLFGDDYHGFPAVKHDVDLFVTMKGLNLQFPPNERQAGELRTWFLQKSISVLCACQLVADILTTAKFVLALRALAGLMPVRSSVGPRH